MPLALFPTLVALLSHAPTGLPPFVIVLRVVLFTCFAVGLACAAFVWCGMRVRSATTAVATAAGLLALFPIIRNILFAGDSTPHWPFAAVYLILSVVAGWRSGVVAEKRHGASALHSLLAVLALLISANLLVVYGAAHLEASRMQPIPDAIRVHPAPAPIGTPDVYHLVFDSLGRPDVLKAQYQADLSGLVAGLRELGFEVSDGATANYIQTPLSLASMLNGVYINDRVKPDDKSRAPLDYWIQNSAVIRAFKSLGYEFTFIGSSYPITRRHSLADVCDCEDPLIGQFESTVIQGTILNDLGLAGLDYLGHRRKILGALSTLRTFTPSGRPQLVFAHILAPHPPFIFDADGAGVLPDRVFSFHDGNGFKGSWPEYQTGYRNQAHYVAGRLLEVARQIVQRSKLTGRDPIVIIHGDHGPRSRWDVANAANTDAAESLPVFLAIRWPNGMSAGPNPTSLVNVYRAVFNRYYDSTITLLPDRAFVSSFLRPYDFVEVALPSVTLRGARTNDPD